MPKLDFRPLPQAQGDLPVVSGEQKVGDGRAVPRIHGLRNTNIGCSVDDHFRN